VTHHNVAGYSILQQVSCKKLKVLEIQKVAFGRKEQGQGKEVMGNLGGRSFVEITLDLRIRCEDNIKTDLRGIVCDNGK